MSPTRGTEQSGVRPVLVVQTERANAHSPHTVVVPFTTRIRHQLLPSHVLVAAGEGAWRNHLARLGDLPADRMREMADALRAVLDL